ncbi:MAG: DUF192 domain-containing protein, partial [Planctomycetota bacterium]
PPELCQTRLPSATGAMWPTPGAAARPGSAGGADFTVPVPGSGRAPGPLERAMLGLADPDKRPPRRLKKRLRGTVAREAAERWQAEQASRGLLVLLAFSLVAAGCDEPQPAAPPKSAVEQRLEQQRAAEQQRRAESTNAAQQGEPQNLPTMELPVGDVTLTLMVADNDDERATGLMHRTEMGENEGMLFVFPDARERRFWMENTPLPLDLIFLDAKGVVLAIGQGEPGDRSWIRSRGPAMWVIELNQGRAAEIGIRVGTRFSTSRLPRTIE